MTEEKRSKLSIKKILEYYVLYQNGKGYIWVGNIDKIIEDIVEVI